MTKKPKSEPKSEMTGEKPPDFEKSLAELEKIVEKMEGGELSLEESLQQFERGVSLARACQQALQSAEQKVELLLKKSGGSEAFETVPFATDNGDIGEDIDE